MRDKDKLKPAQIFAMARDTDACTCGERRRCFDFCAASARVTSRAGHLTFATKRSLHRLRSLFEVVSVLLWCVLKVLNLLQGVEKRVTSKIQTGSYKN